MKHYIIVKFKEGFDYKNRIGDIEDIFNKTLSIDGVNAVSVKPSNSLRENRFDLMKEMDMQSAALPLYDKSEPHLFWKEKYGGYIDKKTIFDCD